MQADPNRHWSFSSLSLFEQCARAWQHKNIDRLPDPKGPALERGIIVHETLERAMKRERRPGKLRDLTSVETGWLSELVEKYRKLKNIEVERAIHLDKQWKPVPDQPGRWIPSRAWLTGKLDLYAPGIKQHGVSKPGFLGDWKTGNMYIDKHEDQAELYAIMGTIESGTLEWECDLIYVDHEHVEQVYFDFSDPSYFRARKKSWEQRVAKLYAERRFDKTPGRHCKWCPFSNTKGGPCSG